MSEKRTFGAASRSLPSLRWNSSRCSSGTSPTSRKLITCPSFIAAPFIVPSAATICSAASRLRRSSAACLPSSRATEVGRARAEVAGRLPGRQTGHPRGARDARGRDPVLGHHGRRRRRVAVGVGAAPGTASGGRRRGVGGRRSASAVAVADGVARSCVAVAARRGRRRCGVGVAARAEAASCRPCPWSPRRRTRARSRSARRRRSRTPTAPVASAIFQ